MDHRRYWFKAIKEDLVVMVLSGNNGILVYLDITGFLGFSRLLDYTLCYALCSGSGDIRTMMELYKVIAPIHKKTCY